MALVSPSERRSTTNSKTPPLFSTPGASESLRSSTLARALADPTANTLIISRHYEPLNIFFGYEQYNRYAISVPCSSPQASQLQVVGYIVEQSSFWRSLGRQILGAHRPLLAYVLDLNGEVLVEITRPWTLFTSHLSVFQHQHQHQCQSESMHRVRLGEVKQVWHPWKRMYDLFHGRRQFGTIQSGFLSWDFPILDAENERIAFITRRFSHLLREMLTDSGQYGVSFDSKALTEPQKWILLAAAISVDFDYFSRHSNASSGFGWPFFPFSYLWPTESSSESDEADQH